MRRHRRDLREPGAQRGAQGQQGFRGAWLAGRNAQQDRLDRAEAERAAVRRWSGVDLAETLDDLRIVLEPYCEEAGIEVRWEVPDEIPPVLGRPAQPVAGAAESHQEQRARPGKCRGQASSKSRLQRATDVVLDPRHRYRPRHRQRAKTCSSRSRKAPIRPASDCIFRAPLCARSAAICVTTQPCPAVRS